LTLSPVSNFLLGQFFFSFFLALYKTDKWIKKKEGFYGIFFFEWIDKPKMIEAFRIFLYKFYHQTQGCPEVENLRQISTKKPKFSKIGALSMGLVEHVEKKM